MTAEPRQVQNGRHWHTLLDRWLVEWSMLLADLKPPSASFRVPTTQPLPASDHPLCEGQIRLMPPATASTFELPLTVVVLRAAPPDHWLAAPFSPLSTPASPGELLLKRDPPPAVVSVASATLLREPLLLASRWVDDLEPDETDHLEALYKAAVTGMRTGPLPHPRLGPPLWNPKDPRYDYLEWMAERMDELLEAEVQWGGGFAGWGVDPPSLARAAEGRVGYETAEVLAVGASEWVLYVHPGGDAGLRRVELKRPGGAKPSSALDGGRLASDKGELSSPLVGGVTELPTAFEARLAKVVMPEGDVYTLNRLRSSPPD